MPQFPWPDACNPMLEYLVHRSEEMAESDGRPAAVIWLAVHAWFEGASRSTCRGSAERDGSSLRRLVVTSTPVRRSVIALAWLWSSGPLRPGGK